MLVCWKPTPPLISALIFLFDSRCYIRVNVVLKTPQRNKTWCFFAKKSSKLIQRKRRSCLRSLNSLWDKTCTVCRCFSRHQLFVGSMTCSTSHWSRFKPPPLSRRWKRQRHRLVQKHLNVAWSLYIPIKK